MITDNCARAFSWEVPEQVVPKLGMPTVSRLSNNIRENQDVISELALIMWIVMACQTVSNILKSSLGPVGYVVKPRD